MRALPAPFKNAFALLLELLRDIRPIQQLLNFFCREFQLNFTIQIINPPIIIPVNISLRCQQVLTIDVGYGITVRRIVNTNICNVTTLIDMPINYARCGWGHNPFTL
ncbi:hypothetical protein BIY30_02280 [Gibbsiella quercinecans]|nr:hypothetical protein BIY30_02280 [Gibbsiella quercinecans]